MHLGNFKMLCLVALSLIGWKFCHGSNEFVSVFMEKRASFFDNLPLRSACYHSEFENTSKRRCLSQCLARLDVCNGILFNKERQTCKLIDCNPADAFDGPDLDTGRWDLFWKKNGIILSFQILFNSFLYSLSLLLFFLSMKAINYFRIIIFQITRIALWFFSLSLLKCRANIYD